MCGRRLASLLAWSPRLTSATFLSKIPWRNRLLQHMGYYNIWVITTYGLLQHMGYHNILVITAHGFAQQIGYYNIWVITAWPSRQHTGCSNMSAIATYGMSILKISVITTGQFSQHMSRYNLCTTSPDSETGTSTRSRGRAASSCRLRHIGYYSILVLATY